MGNGRASSSQRNRATKMYNTGKGARAAGRRGGATGALTQAGMGRQRGGTLNLSVDSRAKKARSQASYERARATASAVRRRGAGR